VFTSDGQVMTYTQPPESLGPIATMPYQPKVPASSDCVQFASASLYAALGSVSATAGSGNGSAAATGTGTAKAGGGARATARAAGSKQMSNDAGVVAFSMGVSVVGVVFSALFLS